MPSPFDPQACRASGSISECWRFPLIAATVRFKSPACFCAGQVLVRQSKLYRRVTEGAGFPHPFDKGLVSKDHFQAKRESHGANLEACAPTSGSVTFLGPNRCHDFIEAFFIDEEARSTGYSFHCMDFQKKVVVVGPSLSTSSTGSLRFSGGSSS